MGRRRASWLKAGLFARGYLVLFAIIPLRVVRHVFAALAAADFSRGCNPRRAQRLPGVENAGL